jgi:rare lipoprotein A (peptidoglycan hydrolase)
LGSAKNDGSLARWILPRGAARTLRFRKVNDGVSRNRSGNFKRQKWPEAAFAINRVASTELLLLSRIPRGRPDKSKKKTLRGTASWYGPEFDGKKTASGEIFDQEKLTAAHKTLPLGSKAIVTNLKNGNSVEVEINDRGPYVGRRVIDVSYAAAKELGLLESGLAPVQIELLHETG